MKVGDYVRTNNGLIFKIIGGNEDNWEIDIEYSKLEYIEDTWLELYRYNDNAGWFIHENCKSSPNILELLEEHDVLKLFDKEYSLEYKAEVLLNEEGYKHISNYECSDLLNLEWELISGEHVKILSIVTKELFESMEYKIC